MALTRDHLHNAHISCGCENQVSKNAGGSAGENQFHTGHLAESHSSLLFQMSFKPVDYPIEHIKLMFLFTEAMPFARVDDEIRFYPVALQTSVKLLALPNGIRKIGFALQDQDW